MNAKRLLYQVAFTRLLLLLATRVDYCCWHVIYSNTCSNLPIIPTNCFCDVYALFLSRIIVVCDHRESFYLYCMYGYDAESAQTLGVCAGWCTVY